MVPTEVSNTTRGPVGGVGVGSGAGSWAAWAIASVRSANPPSVSAVMTKKTPFDGSLGYRTRRFYPPGSEPLSVRWGLESESSLNGPF